MRFTATIGETEYPVEVVSEGDGSFRVTTGDRTRTVTRRGDDTVMLLTIDGRVHEAAVWGETVLVNGRPYAVKVADPLRRRSAAIQTAADGPVEVRAIMPGKIAALLAPEGETVRSGQGVVVVEAMKMENEMVSPRDGRITSIRVRPGETVETGVVLFVVE